MDYINELVEEDAPIEINEKMTLKKEKSWLKNRLGSIEKGEDHILVGEIDGKIVSVVNLTPKSGRFSHVAKIGISVLEDYRRYGIATSMMDKVIEIGKKDENIRQISLDVLKPNKNAIKLYNKLGFKKVAELEKRAEFKGEYVDVIVMDLGDNG